ncbi:Fc receptor-like protein 5 [Myripristis murdjan]|uniref:Fc receptor-like protein 5 n=1 Tax=Myripristis murdjan TaxID=586833 RepID=UPI001175D016|nr:Fc receptor-like protein 5 [Myripristis murdjan]
MRQYPTEPDIWQPASQQHNMEITALCMVVASLRVIPNRSQFFPYDTVSLSCEEQGNSSGWRVMRNTSGTKVISDCSTDWGQIKDSHCLIDDLYASDSGVYWCQSGSGRCSDAVNITVTAGSVILESPGLPVMEGSDVTLRCRKKTTPSNLTADFYKDGLRFGNSSTGEMTIHSVSNSDEGFYKCSFSDSGASPESWLAVRVLPSESLPATSRLEYIVLPVVGVLTFLLLLYLWRRNKRKADSADVSYAEVSIAQEVHPRREADVSAPPSPYSTIKAVH